MAYLVLARKYRPQTFEEVLGQEPIARTLQNAITSDRIAHAYLFTGPRGIGKTSMARIMSKALNCKKGPTPSPCNECDSCVNITSANDPDVQEIDGASNRGIAEAKMLRENVRLRPLQSRFRIYIIDEVHMLTSEAFNALLKTLEEPPPHVVFIFATTEPHKIPETIRSRCQRFDFRPLAPKLVVERLEQICAKEGIEIDKAAAEMIARCGRGAMRDALSLCDQIISFAGDKIDLAHVQELLGVVDFDVLAEILSCFAKKDAAQALRLADQLLREGKDVAEILSHMTDVARDVLMLLVSKGDTSLVLETGDRIARLLDLAEAFGSEEELLYVLSLLMNAREKVRANLHARTILEMTFVRLATGEPLDKLSALTDRLAMLERGAPANALQSSLRPQADSPASYRPTNAVPGSGSQCAESTPSSSETTGAALVSPAAADVHASAPAPLDFKVLRERWGEVQQYVEQKNRMVAGALRHLAPVRLEGTTVILDVVSGKHYAIRTIDADDKRRIIAEAIAAVTGMQVQVASGESEAASASTSRPTKTQIAPSEPETRLATDASEQSASVASSPKPQEVGSRRTSRDVLSEPIIKETLKLFDGQVVNVEVADV